MIRSEIIENMFVGNCLVDMYVKCGMMDEVNMVFLNMRLKDVVFWNVMVVGYLEVGRFDDVVRLFEKMWEEKIKMDVVIWSVVILGYV